MLRLTTLGTIRFTGHACPLSPHPLLSQPKRLALFACLALAPPGSLVFRDTLAALLWPEFETTRARRALRQTVHLLRAELGTGVITGLRADGLGLDPASVWCDAAELERAAAAGRLETVLELYGGEFLPGFNPHEMPELERWLDEVRNRLRRKATLAAATLAQRAEQHGDFTSAVQYARRLVELLPYDEHGTRVLMRLLARSGDRAGAVEAYDSLQARLGELLELLPEVRTRRLAAAVRSGDGEALERDLEPGTVERGAGPRAFGTPTIAVLPFAALGSTASERAFAEGLGEMLITELTRRGTLSVTSRTSVQSYREPFQSLASVGRGLGVELVLEGTVLEWENRVRVTAQLLVAAPEHHLWADSYLRTLGDPLELQAELAAAIAGEVERGGLRPGVTAARTAAQNL